MLAFSPLMPRANNRLLRIMALILPVAVLTVLLSQTVSARNTFVITDGDQVKVHTSYASDPARVLDEIGVELSEDDSYTTLETDGVSEITVRRNQTITVNNCGNIVEINSYGETLAELMERAGINYKGAYRVSLPLETMTFDGMEVSVEWEVSNLEVYTVDVPFETSYYYDPTLPEGQEKILSHGQNGLALCRANVVYENYTEQSREVLDYSIVQEPVVQVIAKGTGENVGGRVQYPLIGDGFIVLETGEVLTFTHTGQFLATAYTSWIADVKDITATGTKARVGAIAVDPTVIPYGTRMFIVANDGSYIYGIATAEDCGGDIKGNRLDLFYDTEEECWQFGARTCTVYFLGGADWRGPQHRNNG